MPVIELFVQHLRGGGDYSIITQTMPCGTPFQTSKIVAQIGLFSH